VEAVKGTLTNVIPNVTKEFQLEDDSFCEEFSFTNWSCFPTDQKECILWSKNLYVFSFSTSVNELIKLTSSDFKSYLDSISDLEIVEKVVKVRYSFLLN